MANGTCAYDATGAAHAHDGPPPPEPPPTHGPILDFLYNRHFAPCFPADAANNKHFGTAVIKFVIADDATIRHVELDTSSGYPELDESALDAAKHWRVWFAAAKNGATYASLVRVPVAFNPPDISPRQTPGTPSYPSGTTLLERYLMSIKSSVTAHWEQPKDLPSQPCVVKIEQQLGGQIVRADVLQSCPYNETGKQSVIHAVLSASPLPYKGFESVFHKEIDFTFFPR